MKIPGIRRFLLICSTGWFLGAVGLLCASILTNAFSAGLWAELYFAAVTVLSPAAFAAFGWDKWKAGREGQRIPEKTLHWLSAFGGWPGAILGQQLFRHKTIKPVFRSILFATMVLHVILAMVFVLRQFIAE